MEERKGEEGYVLIGVLFLVFLVLVALSIAAPRMAASIERDREVEMQHRAKQYVRAIKMYSKKFQGAYPPTLEALEKQNGLRFLRKRYKDPMTGKADWKVIHFGQNKMPTAYGFFGQPMAGSSIAGIGPGAMGTNGGLMGNGANGLGTSGLASSGLGTTSTTTPTTGSTDSGTGSGSGSSSFGSGSASNGQTFGGGGIIGVESTSTKKSILEYHKKSHFNEWEFVYDPMADQIMLSNNTNIGTPMGTNGVATPGTFTNQPVNSTIPPQQQQTPTPTQPQQ
ncbi:MAG TPA: hypothetical protein VL346_08850 [Acidobacteriaceae bacterium]|nr:hypothetical protein [Acidobacteriaceae bacterium]